MALASDPRLVVAPRFQFPVHFLLMINLKGLEFGVWGLGFRVALTLWY